jgi:hypothetical protein
LTGKNPVGYALPTTLDPAHEDYDAHMPDELTGQQGSNLSLKMLDSIITGALRTGPTRALLAKLRAVKRYAELYRRLFAEEMSDWPNDIKESLVERHGSVEWLAVGLTEAGHRVALLGGCEGGTAA